MNETDRGLVSAVFTIEGPSGEIEVCMRECWELDFSHNLVCARIECSVRLFDLDPYPVVFRRGVPFFDVSSHLAFIAASVAVEAWERAA
jgi:hypothetical protein